MLGLLAHLEPALVGLDIGDVVARTLEADVRNSVLLDDLAALEGVAEVFGPPELADLAALTAQGFAPADLLAKTRIVLSERRNYDPQAARLVLGALPAWRSLDLDTSLLSPQEVARAIAEWLPGARA